MSSSNLAVLTKSHNIVAAKRKAKREQVKEVVFDDVARREFLTGFHKRKLQKKEAAKKKAQDREKQDRLEARREHRKLLAEQAKKNVEEVERAYGGIVDSDSEWSGVSPGALKGKAKPKEAEEEEYEDEEQLATVTVVEEFDPDSLIHGDNPPPNRHDGEHDGDMDESNPDHQTRPKPKSSTADVAKAKAKLKTTEKAKSIKYQTNAARKADRVKQRKRKLEKADRAGGKGSRRKGGSKGKR